MTATECAQATKETSIALLDLPAEVLSLVATQLDPGDVITLRKTCKYFHAVTSDKSLWIALFDRLVKSDRYPVPLCVAEDALTQLTAAEVEDLVLSVYLTDRRWQSPRYSPRHLDHAGCRISPDYPPLSSCSISAMDILADRWLVVVHIGDAVEIWDLCPTSQPGTASITKSWRDDFGHAATCKLTYFVPTETFSNTTAVAWDRYDNAIILAMSSQMETTVIRFDLSTEEISVGYLAAFTNPTPLYTLRAIHPASQILVFSHALTLCFVHWPTHQFYTVTPPDEGEELWNGVTGITFINSRNVLCVKTRSTDVYTLDDIPEMRVNVNTMPSSSLLWPNVALTNLGERPARIHSHPLAGITLRGVSFSQPHSSRTPESNICSTSFLAYDVLRGLFHYEVQVTLPLALDQPRPGYVPAPLDVTCTLVAAHHMAQLIATSDVLRDNTPIPRSGFSAGSRAFISACAVGARGKRGIWIERQRTHMGRAVYGFATVDYQPVRGDSSDMDGGSMAHSGPAEMNGKRLYEVKNSYDLRDDLTHCAFSEVTGKVVLGTRRGQLQLL